MRINDIITEKKENVPNDKRLWGRAKAEAKKKYKKYPSAYSSSYAAKKYKEWGGTWKSINESFDTSYDWEWDQQEDHILLAVFESDTGDFIYVDFHKIATSDNGWDVGFSRNDLTKATGEGDQFKIFSTVIDIIKTFIEATPDLEYLEFVADKRSYERGNARNSLTRENLYKKMVKTLSSKYELDYKIFGGTNKTKFKLIPKEKLNEVTRPYSYQEAIEFLSARGYERLGSGKFATVFQRKSRPNEVIKIFSSIDSAYTSYLNFLIKNQDNKHFPKVLGKPMEITPDYNAVKLEKLHPAKSLREFGKEAMHLDEFLETGYISEYLETYFEAFPSIKDALERLYDFAHNQGNDGLSSDLINSENIMWRDNTVVFTDPLFSETDLNSMELNEVTRPKTQKDADEILQNAGYDRVGHGSFGAVYQKEGSNKVIKTFNSIDTSYIKFVKMVKNSNYNPHFPMFYGKPMKINEDYYAIKQENLKQYNGDPTAINFYIKYLISEDRSYEPPYYEEIEDIEYEYPRFKEACKMIADLAKNNPDIKLDIQKNNIMKRGRTIVFVDPVANAKNSDDVIKSLPNIGTWPKKEKKTDKKINWSKIDSEILAQLGINENLNDWHDEEWVDISRKVDGKHPPCGDSAKKGHRKTNDNKAYPKCVKKSKAQSMSAKEKENSSRRKRDDQRNKKGKSTNQVNT